jgi:putative oxidoreductase
MMQLAPIRAWVLSNRDLCVETLRIYLGFGLFLKGLNFVFAAPELAQYFQESTHMPFVSFLTVHLVGWAHMCGGILLCLGLLTRIAALIQLPILFSAVMFVHWAEGLFSAEQTLEFTLLVLFLLTFFVVYGSGRLSVDYVLEKRSRLSKSNG